MDLKTWVFSSDDICIEVSSSPQTDAFKHTRTYLLRNSRVKIPSRVPGAHFFLLDVNGKAAGAFCLSRRTVACKIVMASFYNTSSPTIDDQALLYISGFDQT